VHDFIETFLIVFIAGMLVAIAIGIWHRSRVDRAREAARQIIGKQASAFARRRAQLLYVDAYGVEQTAKWEKEKKHIIANVIPDHLLKSGHPQSVVVEATSKVNFWSAKNPLLDLIEKAALAAKPNELFSDFSCVTTGIEYETFCAEALRRAGWNARVTIATGDQGTDIVAERDGKRLVVQCKFYTKPVSNKAVQEVAAARLHEGADQAVVVSNAPYTKSARQLAGTTGVLLLHHDDLASFDGQRKSGEVAK
jgi:restriction system protein